MDCPEVKGESPVEEQLEPLLILEEGDEPEEFTKTLQGVLRVKKAKEDIDGVEGRVSGSTDAGPEAGACESTSRLAEMNEKDLALPVGGLENKTKEEHTAEMAESTPGRLLEASPATAGQTRAVLAASEKAEEEKEETCLQTDMVGKEDPLAPPHANAPIALRHRLKPEDAQQKPHRSSHDFPDTLYELLCALQEGRRLNDQRCSFKLHGRRRCHSEPSTPRHSHKVVFSSMTSLQREEFFELVASSQGRRLDDQRAEFQSLPPVLSPPKVRRPSSISKAKVRMGSWKIPAAGQAVATPPAKEDLYNMIVISQAQGRLEEQRSAAPGPMDDEDFFSLLLKVQGGRMDEQRTELPIALKY